MDTIFVAFAGGDVTVTSVALYNGGQTIINDEVTENSTFSHDIKKSASAQYTNKGLSIGLKLDIPGRKYFDFKSVTISTSGA